MDDLPAAQTDEGIRSWITEEDMDLKLKEWVLMGMIIWASVRKPSGAMMIDNRDLTGKYAHARDYWSLRAYDNVVSEQNVWGYYQYNHYRKLWEKKADKGA